MTDAGPHDLLVELRGPSGGRHPYEDLVSRATDIAVGGVIVRIASLGDIVASKQYAARPKDLEALPEVPVLLDGRKSD